MTTTHQGEIHLNFNGAPIIEGVGADPGFIGKAIPAFTGLVQALCQDPDGDTPDTDTFPILLVRLNTGSCTFRIQENDQLSSHGMSRFQEVIDSFAEEEQEETEEVLNGITGESFTCLKKFLSINASAETTFTVDHGDQATQMEEDDIKDALKLLRTLRKQDLNEESVTVKFAGYLPLQRKAEFKREGSSQIETAKVNPKARGFDDVIKRIEEDRVVSLTTRQSGTGKPSTTILAIE